MDSYPKIKMDFYLNLVACSSR